MAVNLKPREQCKWEAAALGEKGQYLSERLTELQGSIARVAELAEAVRDASDRWRRVRRYVR